MRICLCLMCVWICSSAAAQEAVPSAAQVAGQRRDPTAPSDEILERLAAAAPPVAALSSAPSLPAQADEIVEVVPAFPEITLKGLVLSDLDHGTALLEAGGRKVTVRLAREPIDSILPAPHAARLSGFNVQGIEFRVLDFSNRSLLLQAPDRTVLIQ